MLPCELGYVRETVTEPLVGVIFSETHATSRQNGHKALTYRAADTS